MSKFNNPVRTFGPPLAPNIPLVRTPPLPGLTATSSPPRLVLPVVSHESAIISVGFYLLCGFVLSLYLNDWSFRLLGTKAYLSTVCVALVPAIWLLSGRALDGFQDKVGILWGAFLLLMMMGLPFSYWRTGTLIEVSNYAFRALPVFFYVVAFTTTLQRCRQLMKLNVIISGVVLLSCILFGSYDPAEGRFELQDSHFFANSNELALQLLLGVCALLYLLFVGGMMAKLFAIVTVLTSLTYMLKTGSRGCLISATALLITSIVLARQRVFWILAAVPAVALALMFSPASSLHRLALIFGASENVTESDVGALQSTAQRKDLLLKSVEFTFTHPLLGVGMGQFAVAYSGEAEKKGEHGAFLGSHNSYTQVSSECGLPAFICYMAIITSTLARSLKVYRRARRQPQLKDIEGLAFCLFATAITYSVTTFFFHMAYTVLLPLLSGQVTALYYVTAPLLREAEVKPA